MDLFINVQKNRKYLGSIYKHFQTTENIDNFKTISTYYWKTIYLEQKSVFHWNSLDLYIVDVVSQFSEHFVACIIEKFKNPQ